MECPRQGEAGELVVGYVAGTLDAGTASAFERHIQECEECRELAAAQRAVWSTLGDWRPMPVSSDFDQRLFECIAEQEQRAWWRRLPQVHRPWRSAIPVASACAVLIAAFLMQQPVSRLAPPAPVQPKVQLEQLEHALDDMDMLNQLGVAAAPENPQPSGRI